MTRTVFPFQVEDVSALSRNLHRQLAAAESLPGHLGLMNMLARAAGFRNFQHFRASAVAGARMEVPAVAADMTRVAQVLRHFDAAGRLARWPGRTWQQHLALWALWSRLPAREVLTERQISAMLNDWHGFGDAAILRRTMVERAMVTRTQDGAAYRRVEQVPPPEGVALIRRLHA